MKKAQLIEKLEKSIQAIGPKGPGVWTVEDHGDVVILSYAITLDGCENAPHHDLEKNQDAIWKEWGGYQIVREADAEIKDAGSDGYTDKYGDDIYCEYVTIGFNEEEEQ